jgi:hypothetical protein
VRRPFAAMHVSFVTPSTPRRAGGAGALRVRAPVEEGDEVPLEPHSCSDGVRGVFADFVLVELDAQRFKAEVRLNNEVLADSIERGQLRQTIMQLMAEAIALDVDEVIIQGDTTGTDSFLAKPNGILKMSRLGLERGRRRCATKEAVGAGPSYG